MINNLRIYGVFKYNRNLLGNRISLIAWVPIAVFLTALYIVYIATPIRVGTYKLTDKDFYTGSSSYSDFLIKTNGCNIAYLDPYEESIKQYVRKPTVDLACRKKDAPLFETNGSFLLVSEKSQMANRIIDSKIASCCYESFNRTSEKHVEYSKYCVPIRARATKMESEFIRVTCKKNRILIYEDYFSFVSLEDHNTPDEGVSDSFKLNVLIIGLDSMSRVNLHRQMPETVQFLTDESAVEFLGYNKVGDNTLPNLLAMLTGVSEARLKSTVLTDAYFDNCPFVWNLFKEKGYVTAFGEDASWMGTFNYESQGFRSQPTDYYWNTFNYEAESKIGNNAPLNAKLCLGSRYVYRDMLDYVRHFTVTMRTARKKYFAFFWMSSLSHDFLNVPSIGDDHFKQFFRTLVQGDMMTNTALFFVSDHGIRWGDMSRTFQGQLEARLPFLYVLLPHWFRLRYQLAYTNLQSNAAKLTSPFDVYKTLEDLLDMEATNDEERSIPLTTQASSLFSKISPSRTCKQSGVSERWCACEISLPGEKKLHAVNRSASAIVEWINSKLQMYEQCAKLSLDSIVETETTANWYLLDKKGGYIHFKLAVRVHPGEGVFRSVVRYYLETKKVVVVAPVDKVGEGPQSACLIYSFLKPYCYCNISKLH